MNNRIIINADDLGRSPEINDAIIQSFLNGIITDTSVMVTCQSGVEDLKKKIDNSADLLGEVGCHLCMSFGKPLTEDMKGLEYVDIEGNYIDAFKVPNRYYLNKRERKIIYKELETQLLYIRDILKLKVSHLDSHQHIHFGLGLLPVVVKLCRKNNIRFLRIPCYYKELPLKSRIARKLKNLYIRINGIKTVDFFGSPAQIMRYASEDSRLVESMVHPMYNSKGEIVNKVRIHEPDSCEILKTQVDSLSKYEKVSFSSLV